jgi:SAM-dependent methyltransferase
VSDRKAIEASYFRSIPDDALAQSLEKPFSVDGRATHLMEIAAVMTQLPAPPARIVDLGCGTGWTSAFLARCGYEVVGTDLSVEAVEAATGYFALPGLTYVVHDFDAPLPSDLGVFDGAVFFDSLHHSEDEAAPIRTAYQALCDEGICVVCEPGRGHAHSESSLHASRTFGVRERDMSPQQVLAAAKAAGFARATVLAHPNEVCRNLYLARPRSDLKERLLATKAGEVVRIIRTVTTQRRHWGLVRLEKTAQ